MLFMSHSEVYCKPLSLIRDTEIENFTLKGVQKLFKSAGLSPSSARVIFVQDNTLNAFVAGGSTVFIHTGLILSSDNMDEYMGVLAHETGHVVGSHSVRIIAESQKAQNVALISTILGGVAAVAAGRADVGIAVMAGGYGAATGLVNTHRQSEENSADSIAVDILKKSGFSAKGLLHIMEKIKQEEQLRTSDIPTYMMSHPLTQDRLTFLQHASEDEKEPTETDDFNLVKAKLFSFLNNPEDTIKKYSGKTPAHIYAQSIAYFKKADVKKALSLTEKLINTNPENPYFWELKGQILFETGHISQAIEAYQKAHNIIPDALLVRLSLAHALIEAGEEKDIIQAKQHLSYIVSRDKYLPDAWRFLSIAEGRLKNTAQSLYALIEYNLLLGNTEQVNSLIKKIKNEIKEDSSIHWRVLDIEEIINKKDEM